MAQGVKNLPAMQEVKQTQIWVLGWEGPLEEERQLTPVFLPAESQEQESPAGYSPWGHKESDTSEWLNMHRVIKDITVVITKSLKMNFQG